MADNRIINSGKHIGKVLITDDGKSLLSAIEKETEGRERIVITDRYVASYHRDMANISDMTAESSEEKKNLSSIEDIASFMLERNIGRNAVLVGIGGGIITDMCGFAASIYKRGISCINIPTTLLSQVDASVGGKTGVNLHGYKNILGTITQPQATIIYTGFLETLPYTEIRSGLAELVKTALIRSEEFYDECLESCSMEGWYKNAGSMTALIEKACLTKLEIVEKDPYEKGLRRILNLGHTYGHAIEKYRIDRKSEISHGEAVAEGIIIAAKISERLSIAPKGFSESLENDFRKLDLPVSGLAPLDKISGFVSNDKKADGGNINFITIAAPGKVEQISINIRELERICLSLQ